MTSATASVPKAWTAWASPGLVWLGVAVLGAAAYFYPGLDALATAWATPEYSHGPLIPVLSSLLFLRQLKYFPPDPGPKRLRWPGVAVVVFALAVGGLGRLAGIADIVAYATILWVGGMILLSFGWITGRHFWPPVLHLVYMLPLPGVLYYKLSAWLQLISSELGVWFLYQLQVPVYLEGNIIDLGVTKLHVAEACSGLRYLFPILSFSYIFAVLYRGPVWHKAVLLISAAPITVLMNAVRIAIAGYIVDVWGLSWVEGFTHFFEGWVIFIACVVILFALARLMLLLHPARMGLAQALDLDLAGLAPQLARLRLARASGAMVLSALVVSGAAAAWLALPAPALTPVARQSFAAFPHQLGPWRQLGPPRQLEADVAATLAADDYRLALFARPGAAAPVEFFSAWYADQSQGGVHSPEICLPGGGWEIAWLERSDMTAAMDWPTPFLINRAIIQKGEARMMVYYWFDQKGRKIAWDFAAKYWLMVDGIATGRTDGALVRLTTAIVPGESDAAAEARLMEMLRAVMGPLPRFVPAT